MCGLVAVRFVWRVFLGCGPSLLVCGRWASVLLGVCVPWPVGGCRLRFAGCCRSCAGRCLCGEPNILHASASLLLLVPVWCGLLSVWLQLISGLLPFTRLFSLLHLYVALCVCRPCRLACVFPSLSCPFPPHLGLAYFCSCCLPWVVVHVGRDRHLPHLGGRLRPQRRGRQPPTQHSYLVYTVYTFSPHQ